MLSSTLLRRALVAGAVVIAVAACSSSHHGGPAPSAPASTAPASSSPIAQPVVASAAPTSCATGGSTLTLTGPSGYRIDAVAVGSGATAAVFLHEMGGGADACGFWDYAHWLTSHYPVQAVLVNRCGYGATQCPTNLTGDAQITALTQPAVDYARAHGANRVVLVGASAGASDALEAAGVLTGVDAVVALSADVTDTGGVADPSRVRVPALYVVAPDDPLCPLPAAHAVFARLAGAPNRFYLDPVASEHGWNMLTDATGAVYALAPVVAAWIAGRYSS